PAEEEEPAYEDEDEGTAAPSGDVVKEGTTTTGADGAAHFEFDTAQKGDDGTSEYDYRVEADVIDLSERSVSGTGSVKVVPGELVLDSRSERAVALASETVKV